MSWFHTHQWGAPHYYINPPYPDRIKFESASEDMWRKILFGFTVIQQICETCGEVRTETVTGKIGP